MGFDVRKLTCRLCVLVMGIGTAFAVQAATVVDFSWTGSGGYSVNGSFSYDPAITPPSFSENPGAVGPTKYLESFTISFFSPQNTLLETGSSVVNGISSDRFLRLDYNSVTNSISSLDGDVGGTTYQYFLTNLRTPGGQVVGPGVTGFNLFVRTPGTPNLDTASSVAVTPVTQTPEPGSRSLVTVAAIAGLVLARRFARN